MSFIDSIICQVSLSQENVDDMSYAGFASTAEPFSCDGLVLEHAGNDSFELLMTNACKIVSKMMDGALSLAFDNGGFVAGGFVRFMRRRWIDSCFHDGDECSELSLWNAVADYVKNFGGDIDVFFMNEDSFKASREAIEKHVSRLNRRSSPPNIANSELGTATNVDFFIESVSRCVRLQLVSCVTGSPDAVLSTFDLTNSCAAFSPTLGVLLTPELDDIERHRCLMIRHAINPNLLWRVKKYINKYHYDNSDVHSKELFGDWLKSEYFKLNDTSLRNTLEVKILLNNNSRAFLLMCSSMINNDSMRCSFVRILFNKLND